MGREWYSYLSHAKSIRRGGGGGGGSGGGRDSGGGGAASAAATVGCIGSLFHIFDFHHFQFCLSHHQHNQHDFNSSSSLYSDEHPHSLKGTEAPRNSLETDEISVHTASLASITEEIDEDGSIPMGITINTRRRDTKLRLQVPSSSRIGIKGVGDHEVCSSESSGSPGPRTPNLVARLMGLEALPDGASTPPNNTTPRSSSSSSSQTKQLRSLRQKSSSVPLRSSDVEGHHHRLSLQISKENRMVIGEVELPRHSCSAISTKKGTTWRDGFDENRSPGHYARQVVKQAKENVLGRKFGVDITNRNEKREQRKDEHLISFKAKKSQNGTNKIVNQCKPSENATPTPSRSPRLRAVEQNPQTKAKSPTLPPDLRFQSTLRYQEKQEPRSYKGSIPRQNPSKPRPKTAMDSVPRKKDELFVKRASNRRRADRIAMIMEWKKPLMSTSDDVVVLVPDTMSRFLPLKKQQQQLEYSSPTSAEDYVPQHQSKKEQQQQLPHLKVVVAAPTTAAEPLKPTAAASAVATATQLPSNSCCNNITVSTVVTTGAAGSSSRNDFKYITRILNHIGIDRNAPLSLTKWFSPSHPLNPSIFRDLEALYFSKDVSDDGSTDPYVGLQCNRRLLFDLVDQILIDAMKPNENIFLRDGHGDRRLVYGSQLAELVSKRVRSLPSTNCRVLKDIDALIERDTPWLTWGREAFEEEVELIALEIEHNIVDSLVREMVSH